MTRRCPASKVNLRIGSTWDRCAVIKPSNILPGQACILYLTAANSFQNHTRSGRYKLRAIASALFGQLQSRKSGIWGYKVGRCPTLYPHFSPRVEGNCHNAITLDISSTNTGMAIDDIFSAVKLYLQIFSNPTTAGYRLWQWCNRRHDKRQRLWEKRILDIDEDQQS